MSKSLFGPIKTLILAAALWLPLTFFVWFAFRYALLQPLAFLTQGVFDLWAPELVYSLDVKEGGKLGGLSQHHFYWGLLMQVNQEAIAAGKAMGTKAIYELDFNPLIYGYGLPLFVGLVLATPLSIRRRLIQIAIATPVLYLFQTWGCVFDLLQMMAFKMERYVTDPVLIEMGANRTFIVAGYQLGYLLMPSVVPLLLWTGLNLKFLEKLMLSDDDADLDTMSDEDSATKPEAKPEAKPETGPEAKSENGELSNGNR